jgi:hypothetical protein
MRAAICDDFISTPSAPFDGFAKLAGHDVTVWNDGGRCRAWQGPT